MDVFFTSIEIIFNLLVYFMQIGGWSLTNDFFENLGEIKLVSETTSASNFIQGQVAFFYQTNGILDSKFADILREFFSGFFYKEMG